VPSDKFARLVYVSLAPATRTAATAKSVPLDYVLPVYSRPSVEATALFAKAASAMRAAHPILNAAVVKFASLDFAWHAAPTQTAAMAKRVFSALVALVQLIYNATWASASTARTELVVRLARPTLSAALVKFVRLAVAALALPIPSATLV
jgi:hypothetical protein